jgi:hypothetical protein
MRCVIAIAVLALVALASAAGSCSATVRGASYDLTTLVQTGYGHFITFSAADILASFFCVITV